LHDNYVQTSESIHSFEAGGVLVTIGRDTPEPREPRSATRLPLTGHPAVADAFQYVARSNSC